MHKIGDLIIAVESYSVVKPGEIGRIVDMTLPTSNISSMFVVQFNNHIGNLYFSTLDFTKKIKDIVLNTSEISDQIKTTGFLKNITSINLIVEYDNDFYLYKQMGQFFNTYYENLICQKLGQVSWYPIKIDEIKRFIYLDNNEDKKLFKSFKVGDYAYYEGNKATIMNLIGKKASILLDGSVNMIIIERKYLKS